VVATPGVEEGARRSGRLARGKPVEREGDAGLHLVGREAQRHHVVDEATDGVVQPAPAPRFSATPGVIQGPPPKIGAHNDEALADWGFSAEAIAGLKASGAL